MVVLLVAQVVGHSQTVIYDNGAPNHVSASNMAYFIGAEDFTLASSETIVAVRAWLSGDSGYAGSIEWAIYADGGQQPGAVLASGNSPATFTATGVVNDDGFTEYQMDFPIPPFLAAGYTTYWLGIRNAVPNPQHFPSSLPPFDWEFTNYNSTFTSWFYGYGCCGAPRGWNPYCYGCEYNNSSEHAFQLLGNGCQSLVPDSPACSLTIINPFAPYAPLQQAPPILDVQTVVNSPLATSLAADGESAVVLVYQSSSSQPVTFNVSASGTGLSAGSVVGSLGPFDPEYLAIPNPVNNDLGSYTVTMGDPGTLGPDAAGNYTFLALLWSPNTMPIPGVPLATLTVSAAQQGQNGAGQASVALEPPPVLLVHGVWSNAAAAGFSPVSPNGFYGYISGLYPHQVIVPVDYGSLNSLAFSDPSVQGRLLTSMGQAVARAAAAGMAARTVDVVAHSMGGLVTRYFLSTSGYLGNLSLPQNPVHKLISIGTPHLGTNLATFLANNQDQTTVLTGIPLVGSLCGTLASCTLGNVFSEIGKPVGPAVQSMETGSAQLHALSPSSVFSAIVGTAPANVGSRTEKLLDVLINAFAPGQTVSSILNNQLNDTIVPIASQDPPGTNDTATVAGIVHSAVSSSDTGETTSQTVWNQVFWWLTGGTAYNPAPDVSSSVTPKTPAASAPPPVLDLSGYTQVAASSVAFEPATGSNLTINSATNITVALSTKTIAEVLLLQTVADPADTVLFYATQSPFTISFVPTRLGTANFTAIAVFNDNTYATAALSYTLQPSDAPYALSLLNAPSAHMTVGSSQVIEADALFNSGAIDVTQVASYTARSGSQNVFSVSPNGTIIAKGNGVDLLDVSYGGISTTTQIPVGPCTYALNPSNQIVPMTGGTVTIQVTTQSGCAWTAGGGASWLAIGRASGSGNGTITLTAASNRSGGTQTATVTLAGLMAVLNQPATACTYSLSQTQINAPAAGASGIITATTSCPVVTSSNTSWLTATLGGPFVEYSIAPNNGAAQRTAMLTIGSVSVPVTQAGFLCSLKGNGVVTAADVQLIINQALGGAAAANDLNGDGTVNAVDVQIVINAALGLGCSGS
jgi:pimeloyl-ACP methyl ester carboxylesterase